MSDPHRSRHPVNGDTPPKGHTNRPAHRTSAAAAAFTAVNRLTDRDRTILDWVDRHGTFTTAQLAALFFTSASTAAHRLATLHELRVLDRFRRPRPGGGYLPWHWVIAPLGARIAAAARNELPPSPARVRTRWERLAASRQLDHHIGVNAFFADLHVHARASNGAVQVLRWWSATETAARYRQRIHPDGHALWHRTATGRTVGLFLEYDTGTETLHRLVAKLNAYDALAADGGPAFPVLFWLPTPIREANLHTALADRTPTLPAVATGVHGRDPAGPVWALLGQLDGRQRLEALPSRRGQAGSPYNPNAWPAPR